MSNYIEKPDDNELVTHDWLRTFGETKKSNGSTVTLIKGNWVGGSFFRCYFNDEKSWSLSFLSINLSSKNLKTRGDVRRLLFYLGMEVSDE